MSLSFRLHSVLSSVSGYHFLIAVAALVHLGFKCLPLALHTGVAFQLHLCLPPLESIFLVAGNEIGEKQGIGPLGAVFGQDAYEE